MLPRFAIKVNFGEKRIITVNQGSILCAQHSAFCTFTR